MKEETKRLLEQRIANMESEICEIKKLLKEAKCENENFNNRLFSEVAKKGDEVWLYGKLWYVMKVNHGIVKLISNESVGEMSKGLKKDSREFCRRLHEYSQEYIEERSEDSELLHTKVRSCTKKDLDKYLNRKVERGETITDSSIWYTDYEYWLASPSSAYRLWTVHKNGNVKSNYNYSFGVRPVVYLKSDVRTISKDKNGVWILEE